MKMHQQRLTAAGKRLHKQVPWDVMDALMEAEFHVNELTSALYTKARGRMGPPPAYVPDVETYQSADQLALLVQLLNLLGGLINVFDYDDDEVSHYVETFVPAY